MLHCIVLSNNLLCVMYFSDLLQFNWVSRNSPQPPPLTQRSIGRLTFVSDVCLTFCRDSRHDLHNCCDRMGPTLVSSNNGKVKTTRQTPKTVMSIGQGRVSECLLRISIFRGISRRVFSYVSDEDLQTLIDERLLP